MSSDTASASAPSSSPSFAVLRDREGRFVTVRPTPENPCIFVVRHASEAFKQLRRGMLVRSAGGALTLHDAAVPGPAGSRRSSSSSSSSPSFSPCLPLTHIPTLVEPTDLEVRCCGGPDDGDPTWLPLEDFLQAADLADRFRSRHPKLAARFLSPGASPSCPSNVSLKPSF